MPNLLPSLLPKLPYLMPSTQPRVQPNLLPRWQPSLQMESPFLSCAALQSQILAPEKVAHRPCLSVQLNMHPNRQFPLFCVDMPSYWHVLFCVTHPLHSNQGGRETVIWGMFPRGCEDTVAHRWLLSKGEGGGYPSASKNGLWPSRTPFPLCLCHACWWGPGLNRTPPPPPQWDLPL